MTNRVWKISDPAAIARIQALMADKKLLIADGHHRYETALAFRNENPGLKDAEKVMMTFVNMNSPGLEILATHRVLSGISADLVNKIPARPLASIDELKQVFRSPAPDRIRIGLALGSGEIRLYERDRKPGRTGREGAARRTAAAALSASAKKRCGSRSISNTCEGWTPPMPKFATVARRSLFCWSR